MEDDSRRQWEALVSGQLKSPDIYSILKEENLEGLEIDPVYFASSKEYPMVARAEEYLHLVSPYQEQSENESLLLSHNVEGLEEKNLFVDNRLLAEHILSEENRVFSLVDVFTEEGKLDQQLALELQAKGFARSLCVDISAFQNAGASIVQQLAVALSKARELVEAFSSDVLKEIIFKVAVGRNYFFELAKLRALRLVFAELCREYGAEPHDCFIFAEPSMRNKTVDESENNLIRSTYECVAAMLGGADAIYLGSFQPTERTEFSLEVSFKQQLVLSHESLLNVFDDPMAGSFYMGPLTQQVAEKTWSAFLEIEEKGGFTAQMIGGQLQRDVYEHALREQQWLKEGKITLVGVNLYPSKELTKELNTPYNPKEIRPVRLSEIYE